MIYQKIAEWRNKLSQNIFDNKEFFEEYKKLRETDNNYNDLLEQPAMKNIMPDLSGKTILDIGCGYGNNCIDFLNAGAVKVVGIDISEKMLSVAKSLNHHENIEYIQMDMSDISKLNTKFDLVYSSLAFHYAEDFEKLVSDIFCLLNENGELLFSQEHPLVTASKDENGGYYLYNTAGKATAFVVSDYSYTGKRSGKWFVDGVENYHRTFSDIINSLCRAGFIMKEVCEPLPGEYAVMKRNGLSKEFIKPTFLIVRAKKPKKN